MSVDADDVRALICALDPEAGAPTVLWMAREAYRGLSDEDRAVLAAEYPDLTIRRVVS